MTISSEYAARHFAHRLAVETDPSDVHAALGSGADLVVIDVRSRAAWDQGHVPGAVHGPHADLPDRGRALVPEGTPAVVYCWGPGCNGATRGALALARLGIGVKEMIGGFEWWAREGLPVEHGDGVRRGAPDPLVAVVRDPLVAPGVAAAGPGHPGAPARRSTTT